MVAKFLKLHPVVQVIILAAIALALFLVYTQGKKFYDKQKLKKLIKQQGDSGITTPEGLQVNLASVATEIYDSFHGSMFDEDEERAVAALKRVPKASIAQLEALYTNLFSKNMRNDFVNYLSGTEYNSIKYLFD